MKKMLLVMVVAIAVFAMPARLSADSITPALISIVDNLDGTFNWTWELTLSPGSVARSAVSVCGDAVPPPAADCLAPPVEGSAMFNFYDFFGAVDFFGGALGDGADIDVSGLSGGGAYTGGADTGWFSLIYPLGDDLVGPLLEANQECANNVVCPGDSGAITNVLVAYVDGPDLSGVLQGGIFGFGSLGNVVIRSTVGTLTQNPEAYAGFDWSILNSPHPQTNYGTYLGPSQVPEPATMFLLGTGLLGIGSRLRKKNKKDKDATTV